VNEPRGLDHRDGHSPLGITVTPTPPHSKKAFFSVNSFNRYLHTCAI
jgi:hypothetical protein